MAAKRFGAEIWIQSEVTIYFDIASCETAAPSVNAIFPKNNRNFASLILIFGAVLVFPSMPAHFAFGSSSTYLPPESPVISVNLTSSQVLRIIVPATSNVSVLSLTGGQYDLGLYKSGTRADLLFTPVQTANYSMVVNVSSSTLNYADMDVLSSPADSWMKNVTGTGNLILDIAVTVLPQPVSEASGWNPLFGFTGISLGGITINATDFLAIFAVFSVVLLIAGMKFSKKLVYGGLFFLSIIAMIEVGILFVGVVIVSYFAGFAVIKSYFGFRSRRQKP